MKRVARLLYLLVLLIILSACSNASPTATPTPAEQATATAQTSEPTAAAGPSPTRSGGNPVPTATAPRASATPATPLRPATTPLVGTPLPTLAAGQVYRDPQARFSFTIPSNWTQVQAAGAEVAFQAPAPTGVIPATVNIVLEKLPASSVTLDEYDQAGEANLKQQFPDYKAVSVTKVIVDGHPAYKRVYTATIANRLLQLQQVYFIEKDVAYVISCGAPAESYASNAAIFDQISGTFKIGVGR